MPQHPLNPLLVFAHKKRQALHDLDTEEIQLATRLHSSMPEGWRDFRNIKMREPKHLLQRYIQELLAHELTPPDSRRRSGNVIDIVFFNVKQKLDCGFTSMSDAEGRLAELNAAWSGYLRMSIVSRCGTPNWAFAIQLDLQ